MNQQVTQPREDSKTRAPSILAVVMVLLYALGIYSVLNLFVYQVVELGIFAFIIVALRDLVSRNILAVTIVLGGVVLFTVVSVPLLLRAMARFGRKVMTFAVYAPSFVIIGVGLALSMLGGAISAIGIIFAALGGVMLFFLLRWRTHIRNSGYIFELSAKAVASEPGVIVPSILYGLFALFNGALGVATGIYVTELVQPFNNSLLSGLVFFLVELGFVWLLFSTMYIVDGTIIGMVDDWYRNPAGDHTSLAQGFSRVNRVLGPVVQFGFVMALLSTIARRSRQSSEEGRGGVGGAIVAFLSSLAYGFMEFVTYFTLPAMIIEDKGFRDGIKSSYTLIWRNWVDVLLSFMGLGTTYTLFMVAMLALYGTAGAVVGWFLVSPALVTLTPQFLASILSVLAFILFGFIPAYFLFRPLKVAYNTILYEFAVDKDSGFQLSSRMPLEIQEQLEATIILAQVNPTTRRWPEPKFHDEEIVNKITNEFNEVKMVGLSTYMRSELYGEARQGTREAGPMTRFQEHLHGIGVNSELLESGDADTINEPCIRLHDQSIDFIQVQGYPGSREKPTSSNYQYHYAILMNIRGLEKKLSAELRSPNYWKLDLNEKRIIDFQWDGGELARILDADLQLKEMLIKGGLDKLVIRPDREHPCIRIVHMPGQWSDITIGSAKIKVGREALPDNEAFKAYNRIAEDIRSISAL